ncbi:MAG: T9SS type A sorting domain-containing protein [Sphingobacteriaceae bacterium]|nr:T9SS type A sorting domain-containing protein [Sphingobacteriaceae bacterium]
MAIFCLFVSTLIGQGIGFQWAKNFADTFSAESRSVKIDILGNIYTTGTFSGTADFDPGPGIFTLTANGIDAVFISKLDVNGNLIWARQFGGSVLNKGYDITIDASGNIFTTGTFQGNCDFDTGPGIFSVFSPSLNVFIHKLDPSGNFVWVRTFSGAGSGYGYGISTDMSGNIYTCGEFGGTYDFDTGPGTFTLSSNGGMSDLFLHKLDASGNFVWAGVSGSVNNDVAYALTNDISGNVYICGSHQGVTDFDFGLGVTSLTASGLADIFICKYNSSGALQFARQLGGSSWDEALSIFVDNVGNIFTTGVFSTICDFDPNPFSQYWLTSSGQTDAFVSKLDPNGNFIMARQLGGNSGDAGYSIKCDVSGNIYTTGRFSGTCDFDPGPGFLYLTSMGSTDIFINKLSPTGNLINSGKMGSIGVDTGYSLCLDGGGNTCITGSFDKICDFDPGAGTYTLSYTSPGKNFIMKLCSMNTPTITASGTTTFCQGGSVTLSSSPANSYSWSNGATTQSISTNQTGNYLVIVSNSVGCLASSNSISVLVNILPTISVNNGTICPATNFTILPTGANSYTYEGGSAVVSPTSNATYTVIGASLSGCLSSNIATVNVIVASSPTLSINSGTICSGSNFTLSASGAQSYTYPGGNPVVSPIFTSTFFVVGSSSLGCTSTGSTVIVVNPIPTISVNSGSLCLFQSYTLNALGANSYTWFNGSNSQNVIITPSVSGTYSVIGTSLNNCSGTGVSTIIVYSLPTINILSSHSQICLGETATLSAIGADNYSWSPGTIGNLQVVNPTLTTNYTVTGTSFYGCSSEKSFTLTVLICNSINNYNDINKTFLIYPNPAFDHIHLLNNSMKAENFECFDLMGHKIWSKQFENGDHYINLSDLTPGVYILKSNNGSNNFNKTIIKQP